jgi:hypothetical protein
LNIHLITLLCYWKCYNTKFFGFRFFLILFFMCLVIVLLHWLHQKIINFNLFERYTPRTPSNIFREQLLTRIFLILISIFSIAAGFDIFFVVQSQVRTISEPYPLLFIKNCILSIQIHYNVIVHKCRFHMKIFSMSHLYYMKYVQVIMSHYHG